MTLECKDAGSCHNCCHALQVSFHSREGEDQSWRAHTAWSARGRTVRWEKQRKVCRKPHIILFLTWHSFWVLCLESTLLPSHYCSVSIWCLLISQRGTGRTVVRSSLPIIPEKQWRSRKGPLPSPVPLLPEKEYFSALRFICWSIIHGGCVYILCKMSPC